MAHIAIGAAPLSVEADRIVVISDPADALGDRLRNGRSPAGFCWAQARPLIGSHTRAAVRSDPLVRRVAHPRSGRLAATAITAAFLRWPR